MSAPLYPYFHYTLEIERKLRTGMTILIKNYAASDNGFVVLSSNTYFILLILMKFRTYVNIYTSKITFLSRHSREIGNYAFKIARLT